MTVSGSYADQLAAVRQRSITDARVSYASQNVNPALAQGVVAQSKAYPFVSPQTAYALAANGNTPGDPVSQAVAAGVVNKRGGGFWHSLGQVVTAPLRAAESAGSTVLGDASTVGKGVARVGFGAMQSLYQVPTAIARDAASAGGDIVGGAVAGAETGGALGLIGGSETGPGALVTGAIGAVGGAILGGVAQARGVKVKGTPGNPLAQTTLGVVAGDVLSGNKVDLGSGFLPAGAVSATQAKNAEAAANIDGHALTPGRMLASALARPGTTPYNVLSGLTDAVDTWELDPANRLLDEAGVQRAVGKLIPVSEATEKVNPVVGLARRAGLLEAADPAVQPEIARNFLTSDPAVGRFVDKVATTDSASAIRDASGGKIPSAIANQLAAMTDRQQIVDTLVNGVTSGDLKERAAVQAGRDMASTFTTFKPAARLTSTFDRLGSVMPAHSVDLLDMDQPGAAVKLDNAVDQLGNWLKQARYSAADRAPILDRLMATTTAAEGQKVFEDTISGDFRARLAAKGVDSSVIDRLVGSTKDDKDLLLNQTALELAQDRVPAAVNTGTDLVPLNPPNQLAEHFANTVDLPDARAVRQLTTPTDTLLGKGLDALYNSDRWKSSVHAGDYFMQKWKVANLARPALAVRMLAMSAVKMAAGGLDTDFSDPMHLVQMAFSKDLRPQFYEGLREGTPLSQVENYQQAMSGMTAHISDDAKAAYQTILKPGDDGFARSWSAKIAELHADPVARSIADQGFEGAANSFWDGPLADTRKALADSLNRPDLLTADSAQKYVNDEVGSHIHSLTADNPDLLRAVATGKIATAAGETPLLTLDAHADAIHQAALQAGEVGTPAYDAAHQAATSAALRSAGGRLVNPDVEGHLNGLVGDANITTPNEIVAPKPVKVLDPDYGNKVGKATQWFYSTLIKKPMDTLIHIPMFNQLFWKEVADSAPLLDEAGATALRARMASDSPLLRVPDEARAAIQAALDHPQAGQGAVTFDKVEELAKERAIDGVQARTIQPMQKTGWQDSMRLMMPFAKHWQQEVTQWAKIAVDHPDVFRKAQMTVQGAIGSGFFHKDQYGSYVFNYPGSELVSKVLTGTPMPLTGRVSGLSMMSTSLLPGFGPLVSIAASKILPNKPEFDTIRNFLSPMGDPLQQGVLKSVEPSWAKTLQTALADPEQDRAAGNTTMEVAKYLVSTGKYSTDTPEAQDELLTEASARAKKLLELEALGKFVLPSSPSLVPMAQDKDGRTVVAKLLTDDLAKMRQDDYANSTQNFLAKYGDGAALFMQASSRPLVPGDPTTKEQENFARSNPDVAKALPNTAAFFAPQGGQTFDPGAIARQIGQGTRQSLTPKQQVAMANDQVASMIYYTKKAQLGARISQPQQAWLDSLKGALMQDYPGFNTITPGVKARVTDSAQNVQDVLIPELRKSLTIDKTANSQTGQSLAAYLHVRDEIDQMGQAGGLKPGSFTSSPKMVAQRQYLRTIADRLGAEDQGFAMLFDRVLSKELHTDTAVPTPTSA